MPFPPAPPSLVDALARAVGASTLPLAALAVLAAYAATGAAPDRRAGRVPDDRFGAVQLVRLAAGGTALSVLGFAPALPAAGWPLAPAIAGWLALTSIAELARRHTAAPGRIGLGLLLLDAVVLGAVVARTGGLGSPLAALVHLHVVAVAVLVSHRAGAGVGVLHGVVQLGSFVLAASATAKLRLPAGTSVESGARTVAVQLAGLVALTAATAGVVAAKERVLRRTQREIGALAAVGRATTVAADLPFTLRAAATSLRETLGVAAVAVSVDAPEGSVGLAVSAAGFAEVTGGTAPGLASPRLVRRLADLDDRLDPLLPGATDVAVLPLRIDHAARGVLLVAFGSGRRRRRVPESTTAALEQAARLIASTIERARLHASLEELAARDTLTGLVNRRVFEETLVREVARSKRTREPLSLVVVDVDHFKRVNDIHGHHVGDEVLRHVGKALGGSVRASDLVARFGGEEFVALLPGCGPADAHKVAENLRTAIAADGPPVPVTASAGVASYPAQATDGASLFEAADAALYEAKRGGRDRTVQAARRIQLAC